MNPSIGPNFIMVSKMLPAMFFFFSRFFFFFNLINDQRIYEPSLSATCSHILVESTKNVPVWRPFPTFSQTTKSKQFNFAELDFCPVERAPIASHAMICRLACVVVLLRTVYMEEFTQGNGIRSKISAKLWVSSWVLPYLPWVNSLIHVCSSFELAKIHERFWTGMHKRSTQGEWPEFAKKIWIVGEFVFNLSMSGVDQLALEFCLLDI